MYSERLCDLYTKRNLSIGEIAALEGLSFQGIYARLKRCGIAITPATKARYQNRRNDVHVPKVHSAPVAELFGILLGDGHISHFQVVVTLGNKEVRYANHVQELMQRVFGGEPRISIRKKGYRDVYLGSTEITRWLTKEGMVPNKFKSQVDVPLWIFKRRAFSEAFLRGVFDTDGSIYALKYGMQLSFSNRSVPLQRSLHAMLKKLGYKPSAISGSNIYVTDRSQIRRFFREVQPANAKHLLRYRAIDSCVGTQAVKGDAL